MLEHKKRHPSPAQLPAQPPTQRSRTEENRAMDTGREEKVKNNGEVVAHPVSELTSINNSAQVMTGMATTNPNIDRKYANYETCRAELENNKVLRDCLYSFFKTGDFNSLQGEY